MGQIEFAVGLMSGIILTVWIVNALYIPQNFVSLKEIAIKEFCLEQEYPFYKFDEKNEGFGCIRLNEIGETIFKPISILREGETEKPVIKGRMSYVSKWRK